MTKEQFEKLESDLIDSFDKAKKKADLKRNNDYTSSTLVGEQVSMISALIQLQHIKPE